MDRPIEIEDHPDFADIIDNIIKYGDYSKEQLVNMLYDASGEGLTKKDLRMEKRGYLLAQLIDGLYGGKCF